MEPIVLVFDTETTGLIKPTVMDIHKQPQIIEFYALKAVHRTDGVIEQIDEIETFLKPKEEVSEVITKITGITPLMVKNARTFGEFFPEMMSFFSGVDAMVAHNCAFDDAMVCNEILRLAHDGVINEEQFYEAMNALKPLKRICTVQKTMHIEQRRLTLTNLHKELFGVPFEGAHRAKEDVQALFRCYKKCVENGWIKL